MAKATLKTVGNIPHGSKVPRNQRTCEVMSVLRVQVEILSIKNLCCSKPQMIWRNGKLQGGKEITLNIFHEKHWRFPSFPIRRQQRRNIRLVITCCSALISIGCIIWALLGHCSCSDTKYQQDLVFSMHLQEPPDSISMCVCTRIFHVAGSHSTWGLAGCFLALVHCPSFGSEARAVC